jgi:hypothetical protein
VAGTSSGSITHSTVSVSSKTVMRQYNEDHISFGFISSGDEQPRPKCIVCGEKLSNRAMVPSKPEKHLHTKHAHLCEKPLEYFKRLITDQTRQAKQWPQITIIFWQSSKSKLCSCRNLGKKRWNHITIAESVILPACCKIVNIVFGEEYGKEILKISIS